MAAFHEGLSPKPLEDLLKENAEQIEELHEMVKNVLPKSGVTDDGVETDEIFLLRFVLSNKKLDKAASKIKETIQWRMENKELLTSMAAGEPHPMQKTMSQFMYSGITGNLGSGEPISVVRMGLSDFRTLMNTFSVDEVSDYLLYEKEAMFRICDRETRSRGRIVKCITVIDFDQFSMFGSKFNKTFFTALGNSSKASSLYFPQLQAKTVAINTPSYYSMVHSTLTQVMPKSSTEKMCMCPAKKTAAQGAGAAEQCPFMSKYLGVDAVPDFLGGRAPIPSSLLEPGLREGEVPFSSVVVKPRSYVLVEMQLEAGEIVEFEVSVNSYHVYMTAEILPIRPAPSIMKTLSTASSGSYSGGEEESSSSKNKKEPTVEHYKKEKKKARWRVRSAKLAQDRELLEKQQSRFSLVPTMVPCTVRNKDGIVKGAWKIPRSGRLVIKFDNSFSKLRSKKVTYRIKTVPPPEQEEERSWWEDNWAQFAGQAQWPRTADDDWNCVIS